MAYTYAEEETEESPKKKTKTDNDSDESKEEKDEKPTLPKIRDGMWWRASEVGKKPHEILDNVVKQIEDDQQGRYEAYREYERLFGSAVTSDGDSSFRTVISSDLVQNELQNTIETLWAQIFKNRVVPGVSASESDWDEWDRARSYSRWLEGAFDESKVYEEAFPQAGIHMLVHGTGIIRVGWENGCDKDTARIKSWAVNPRYFLVDRLESKHGKPRNCYFKDHVDRGLLWELYCTEDREDLCGTLEYRRTGLNKVDGNDDMDLGTTSTNRCDMITVREAFHLPSGPNSKDGRHVIWIKGCTLLDEPYDWDVLPFAKMDFGAKVDGFYGESAVRRLAPTQKMLDKLNLKIDEAQDVMGVPRIVVGNNGSGLKSQHLDDMHGSVLVVEGDVNNIKDWNAQCASQELYNDRDSAPSKMRALLGISDFEASSQLPAGLRDVGAPFMEHYVEQGQARHAMDHAQYENAVVQLSYLYMLQAEDIQKMKMDVVVKGPADNHLKSSIEDLSFKDVHVDRKRLKLRVQPMSHLPQTFAGKVEAFGKLLEKQLPVDPKTLLRNLEVPDLHGEVDMLVSDEEIIMKNLSYMVKTGEYLAPMPFDNLDLIVQLTTRYINRYRVRQGRDLTKVALLAQYIDDAISLKKGFGGPDPGAVPNLAAGAPGMPMGPMPPPGMDPMAGPLPPPGPMGAPRPAPPMPQGPVPGAPGPLGPPPQIMA